MVRMPACHAGDSRVRVPSEPQMFSLFSQNRVVEWMVSSNESYKRPPRLKIVLWYKERAGFSSEKDNLWIHKQGKRRDYTNNPERRPTVCPNENHIVSKSWNGTTVWKWLAEALAESPWIAISTTTVCIDARRLPVLWRLWRKFNYVLDFYQKSDYRWCWVDRNIRMLEWLDWVAQRCVKIGWRCI